MKKEKLNCEKARNISIVDVLRGLGIFPIKESEKEAWYLSPFRKETKASFKVSFALNSWYDHGAGKGGNVIDLIMQLKKYSVQETLDFLSTGIMSFSFHQHSNFTEEVKKTYSIKKIKNLENETLLRYLISRCIDTDIAKKYCKEIYYEMNGKMYFGIAFGNDSTGYEIRNKYFKGCIGNKNITTIKNKVDTICIFEGFIDFLSYLTLFNSEINNKDYIILNSVAFANQILPIIKEYSFVYTFLDNDHAGKKATTFLVNNHRGALDLNSLFLDHHDLNDYLIFKEKVRLRNEVT